MTKWRKYWMRFPVREKISVEEVGLYALRRPFGMRTQRGRMPQNPLIFESPLNSREHRVILPYSLIRQNNGTKRSDLTEVIRGEWCASAVLLRELFGNKGLTKILFNKQIVNSE